MNITGMDTSSAALQAAQVQVEAASNDKALADQRDPGKAADRMERLFATMLVKELRRALPNGLFGKTPGADTFEGWFDQHIGDSLADSGALDLASQIKLSIEQKQAAAVRAESEMAAYEAAEGE
ncbi:MAG: Rod binding domain-containing protein [Planctomycetota bacterium]|jgi:Rod binding domain-containing protein